MLYFQHLVTPNKNITLFGDIISDYDNTGLEQKQNQSQVCKAKSDLPESKYLCF